jgi:UDP-glucuronate 4-epimerase
LIAGTHCGIYEVHIIERKGQEQNISSVQTTRILITGIAGFIGYHLAKRLAAEGADIVGLDNINGYYDVTLKQDRLKDLGLGAAGTSVVYPGLRFVPMDLTDAVGIKALFAQEHFDVVVNLAAQAGVRYSITNPGEYVSSNIQGFLNILEAARAHPVRHLVYASSSSVYGYSTAQPYRESDPLDQMASLYAVSKRSGELMAQTYSRLYGIPATGLRFFTVYGPWGRPDMAPFLFTRAILENRPIEVYNYGKMSRDFTYIDDIIEGICRVLALDPAAGKARIYNIGNGAPVALLDFIRALEQALCLRAEKRMLPMQQGDVPSTWADCTALRNDTGYSPHTDIALGVKRFVAWYRSYYHCA